MPEMPKTKDYSHPLLELTMARLRESLRQPEAFFWAFVFPALMSLVLGIAFRNSKPEKLPIAVVAQPGHEATLTALANSPDLQPKVLTPEAARQALRSGKVILIVEGHSTNSPANAPSYTYTFYETRPETRGARMVVDDALQRAAGRPDKALTQTANFTEPGARYIDFLVPGLLGLNLLGSGIWGIGFALVQARIQKLLKRLAATPMRRWQFLGSYLLSRLIILFVEVLALLGFVYWLFDVRVYGSLVSFIALAMLGALTFAGLGLLAAARARSIEAAVGIANLVTIPMWLLSGSFFSTARFPEFIQPLIKLIPLTALNDGLRAIMNDGVPLWGTKSQILVLVAWTLISFTVALRLFRWQ